MRKQQCRQEKEETIYFVGIDISKFKHDCAVIDETGDTIQPSWSFENDREGFSLLKEWLDSLPGDKKIGLEATGHYGQNLKLFLGSVHISTSTMRAKKTKAKKIISSLS